MVRPLLSGNAQEVGEDSTMGHKAHFLFVQVRGQADKQALIDLLDPVVTALGYELVDLDLRLGRNGLVRLYIDRPEGAEGGVTLGDCELVSGQVGAFLDVEDPLPGSYVLEVSSPGLDRRLRTAAHFERFVGSEVKVELKHAEQGRRRFRGRLTGIEGEAIHVDVDGSDLHWNLADIAEARLVPHAKLGSG
ncbi:MAG TPA: ribosome maturation factor RimP [Gammaproteobacteria bacterium]|nr:ribosome maturation factor RimP [Gammaproteobacteria bacterium]